MERLLELARKYADAVSVYSRDTVTDSVSFENAKLKDIESSRQSGVSLMLFKDGKMGLAYTRNLIDREELVQNSLISLKAGVEAGYELPLTRSAGQLHTYDPGIEGLTTEKLADECARICDFLTARVNAQVNTSAARTITTIRVLNSRETDLVCRFSSYSNYFAVMYPGSYSSIMHITDAKGFVPAADKDLSFVADTFNQSQKEVKAKTGRTRVMFLPYTTYSLFWRLTAATSGQTVYEKVSPVLGKLGEKLFSDQLTLVDEPHNDTMPGARGFDDEGTPTRNRPIVEAGVLRSFYHDRYYAWKNGVEPTGNGYRQDVTTRPGPELAHLTVKPGKLSFDQLLKEMGSGIIVAGAMGAHSGNILAGEYSIGLSPGLLVEKGEIVGHVKNAMVAGNVYETLKEVVGVEDRVYPGHMVRSPSIVFDNVSFAVKG
ncbi:MAG: metallopeptidase TldD-related protein [candidate division WOR-3 bacterium]